MKRKYLFISTYLLVILGLFLYSYTQVDLSLTLSRASLYQTIEKFFQHIGYFERPFSTYLFIGLLGLLFGFYGIFLKLAAQNKITKKTFWWIVGCMVVILTFSYNAFSYDLFNYIFDAKIFTHYHLNPYTHKALDFAGDPMLSFMHWVERNYPYGPIWLVLTIPLSFIGFNVFLPTFFLFKVLMSVAFIGCIYFVSKILKKINPQQEIYGMVFLAFNPLIIIESLVSAHHDIVQDFFAILAFYLFLNNKNIRSFFMIILSIGVKFATIFLVPSYAFLFFAKRIRIKFSWSNFFLITSLIMIVPTVLESFRSNFQPWYLLNILPFLALVERKYYVIITTIIVSLAGLCIYIPFLYTGNWDKPIPTILFWITTAGIGLSVVISGLWRLQIALRSQKTVK